jgi:hypothetical protein
LCARNKNLSENLQFYERLIETELWSLQIDVLHRN